MDETTSRGQVSRRTIAKGMAWAAPAIPVVAMAPKAAASPVDECVTITFGGAACKWPGAGNQWSYNVELCFTNTCDTDVSVTISRLENNSGAVFTPCGATSFESISPIIVPAGATGAGGTSPFCRGPYAYRSSSSAQFVEVYGWIGPVSGTATMIANLRTSGQGVELPDCVGPTPCVFPA